VASVVPFQVALEARAEKLEKVASAIMLKVARTRPVLFIIGYERSPALCLLDFIAVFMVFGLLDRFLGTAPREAAIIFSSNNCPKCR
jgi:hypothetical protein